MKTPLTINSDMSTISDMTTFTDSYSRQLNFENGYGLSIISHDYSYGGREGLFEIALLDVKTNEIIYNEDLGFGDVIGFLDFEDVAQIIKKISSATK